MQQPTQAPRPQRDAQPDPFDELAGRVEGVARAVMELARMLEAQADIDGPTLEILWRNSVAARSAAPSLTTARRTLLEMANGLAQARARRAATGGRGRAAARIRPLPAAGFRARA